MSHVAKITAVDPLPYLIGKIRVYKESWSNDAHMWVVSESHYVDCIEDALQWSAGHTAASPHGFHWGDVRELGY